jgi:hypothetical protein
MALGSFYSRLSGITEDVFDDAITIIVGRVLA